MSDSLASLISSPVVGVFSADSALIRRVDAFVDAPSTSLADAAAALRWMAVAVYGFDGPDAGAGFSDAEFVSQYLSGR